MYKLIFKNPLHQDPNQLKILNLSITGKITSVLDNSLQYLEPDNF